MKENAMAHMGAPPDPPTPRLKRILKAAARIILVVSAFLIGVWTCITQPTFRSNDPSSIMVDAEKLKAHVVALSETFH
ncbi:hypothetical protein ACFL01_03915, partial [Planctomycetota bacterium]